MLNRKEQKPLKKKDVIKLEDLQLKHPGILTEKEQQELEKLIERRNIYGEI